MISLIKYRKLIWISWKNCLKSFSDFLKILRHTKLLAHSLISKSIWESISVSDYASVKNEFYASFSLYIVIPAIKVSTIPCTWHSLVDYICATGWKNIISKHWRNGKSCDFMHIYRKFGNFLQSNFNCTSFQLKAIIFQGSKLKFSSFFNFKKKYFFEKLLGI